MNERLIFKAELHSVHSTLKMPKNAKILCIAEQFEKICLWYEFEVNDPETVTRKFEVVATGSHFNIESEHIATVQQNNGTFIWHVYEVKELEKPTLEMIKARHIEWTSPGSFHAKNHRFVCQEHMTYEEELEFVARSFEDKRALYD